MEKAARTIQIRETEEIPLEGLVLGSTAMAPFLFLASAGWWKQEWAWISVQGIQIWGSALLLFYSGVRRGLSFRTQGGPRPRQLLMFALLFFSGLIALLLPVVLALPVIAFTLALMTVADVKSAQPGDVPLYFARLRPSQMAIAIIAIFASWLLT